MIAAKLSKKSKLNSYFGQIGVVYNPIISVKEKVQIRSSNDSQKIIRTVIDSRIMNRKEVIGCLYVNRYQICIGDTITGIGSHISVISDIQQLIYQGLILNASGIILFHNHPSGSIRPSNSDINLTKAIKEASNLFGITLVDHIIVTEDTYMSFADEVML